MYVRTEVTKQQFLFAKSVNMLIAPLEYAGFDLIVIGNCVK